MKLLYIAPLPIDFCRLGGVSKKILAHVRFFSEFFETYLIYYFDNNVYLYNLSKDEKSIIGKGKSKIGLLRVARTWIKQHKCEAIYFRYPDSDWFFLRFLKTAKHNESKIVVEIPTFPYDLEGNNSVKGRFIRILDKVFRIHLKRFVDRIVTFSDDEEIFGIKTIRTINGIDFSSVKMANGLVDLKNEIKLVAASSMFKVHGYDRLICGIRDYYNNGGNRNIVLCLAGDGEEKNTYKKIIEEANLTEHAVLLGSIYGNQLDELYEDAAMGVNSLAIHRQGLVKESTLKSREYAAKGLPIISSSLIDAFDEQSNKKYVFNIPADDSPVCIDDLISFLDSLYDENDLLITRNMIRESAYEVCDYHKAYKPVIDFFEGQQENQRR